MRMETILAPTIFSLFPPNIAMNSLLQTVQALIRHHPQKVNLHVPTPSDLQALDDYSRQMEAYLDVVGDLTKSLGKGVKRLRRRQRYFEALIEESDANARQFHQEGQEKLARAAEARRQAAAEAARAYQAEADSQNARLLEFMDAKLALEARLTEVHRERARLEARLARDAQWQPL